MYMGGSVGLVVVGWVLAACLWLRGHTRNHLIHNHYYQTVIVGKGENKMFQLESDLSLVLETYSDVGHSFSQYNDIQYVYYYAHIS